VALNENTLYGTWTDSRTGLNQLYFNRKNFNDVLGTEAVFSSTSFTIFPQPARDYFFLKGINEQTEIEISDMNGRVVMKKSTDGKSPVDISSLRKGMYLLHIRLMDASNYRKLVVQ
jgi:hypothetical protein